MNPIHPIILAAINKEIEKYRADPEGYENFWDTLDEEYKKILEEYKKTKKV